MDLYDMDGVRAVLVATIADVYGDSAEGIESAIAAKGGDWSCHLRSKFAEAVIAGMEEHFGVDLPAPADLPRTKFSTVGALLDMTLSSLNRSAGAA